MSTYDSLGDSDRKFTRPAEHIKALNVGPIPQRIFDDMSKYEDTARGMYNQSSYHLRIANSLHMCERGAGFGMNGFEHSTKNIRGGIIVNHRPEDAQVSQLYRIPSDPSSTELERLTYFDIGSGRIIRSCTPILGEDWRGTLRAGGALMVMDLSGNENFQLWYEARASSSTRRLLS